MSEPTTIQLVSRVVGTIQELVKRQDRYITFLEGDERPDENSVGAGMRKLLKQEIADQYDELKKLQVELR